MSSIHIAYVLNQLNWWARALVFADISARLGLVEQDMQQKLDRWEKEQVSHFTDEQIKQVWDFLQSRSVIPDPYRPMTEAAAQFLKLTDSAGLPRASHQVIGSLARIDFSIADRTCSVVSRVKAIGVYQTSGKPSLWITIDEVLLGNAAHELWKVVALEYREKQWRAVITEKYLIHDTRVAFLTPR